MEWLEKYYMKVNNVKAGHRYETLWANIREVRI